MTFNDDDLEDMYPLEFDVSDDELDDFADSEDRICPYCHGTGQDWDLTTCEECDGECYAWWLP